MTYKCAEPTARCRTVTADTIDDAVADLFLRTMTPQQIQVALVTARAVKPPPPDHDALLALAADLPRLWDADTTSPRDRKRLLRTLIADVTLLPEHDVEAVRIGVRWHTGASDELTVERRGPGRTPPEALAIVREHGATHSNMHLAKMLNDAGLRTGKNLRFTPRHVAGVRGVYKIFTPRTVAVQDGEISVKQAGQLLGIPADAIYNWLRHEQVPALVRAGRWCIPWDAQTQQIYRQKVADSFRLKPNPPRA
ncbi:hypothetical protein [Micromonospora sp. NBC_00617]|uniref:hypothetical protein n=1 Tax=Micromonospora sp. NBC_00617 TaxID=2903587 RepID=UPI0030DEFAEB